jgi:hypothetical protein
VVGSTIRRSLIGTGGPVLSGCLSASAQNREKEAHPLQVVDSSYRTDICVRLRHSIPLYTIISVHIVERTYIAAFGHLCLTSAASCLLGGAPP